MSRAWRLSAAAAIPIVTLAWAASSWTAGSAWASAYPPTITPMCTVSGVSAQCSSVWYAGPVWLSWTWTMGAQVVTGCVNSWFTSDVQTSIACAVKDSGGATSVVQNVNVEVSSPSAYGVATRPPDRHGWYNHPLAINFKGAAFSGIQSCTSTVYAGPVSPVATVPGSCTDNAGKVAPASLTLRYSGAPPSVRVYPVLGDRLVVLRWAVADIAPISQVRVTRTPGLHGHRSSVIYSGRAATLADHAVSDGVRYRYWLRLTDVAGNTSTQSVVVIPDPLLLAPVPGARLGAPPRLSWTPVAGATYYNVQVFRGGKVLSAWPRGPRLQLPHTWRFNGRRYRLRPGHYRWYVWPGFGSPAAGRYGELIGSRRFTIT